MVTSILALSVSGGGDMSAVWSPHKAAKGTVASQLNWIPDITLGICISHIAIVTYWTSQITS